MAATAFWVVFSDFLPWLQKTFSKQTRKRRMKPCFPADSVSLAPCSREEKKNQTVPFKVDFTSCIVVKLLMRRSCCRRSAITTVGMWLITFSPTQHEVFPLFQSHTKDVQQRVAERAGDFLSKHAQKKENLCSTLSLHGSLLMLTSSQGFQQLMMYSERAARLKPPSVSLPIGLMQGDSERLTMGPLWCTIKETDVRQSG